MCVCVCVCVCVYEFIYLFTFEREREAERQGDRGSEAGSAWTAASPNGGLELMNREIVTWGGVGRQSKCRKENYKFDESLLNTYIII